MGASSLERRLGFAAGLVVAIAGVGVVAAQQAGPARPIAGGSISIDAAPVALNPENPSASAIGDFRYAGGLILTSQDTDQLHGLSDVEVADTDRLSAVGDMGIFLDARLVLDGAGRLVGLADAHVRPIAGEDGQPLAGKGEGDAEGLALFPNGDRLVSFERHHRIWLYPAAGGPPRPVPVPATSFPRNGGMEALAADPESGADAYIVGGEVSGDTWTCQWLSTTACSKGPTVDKPEEFGLVAIKRLPGNQTAYLLRAFDQTQRNRVSLRIVRAGMPVARLDLAKPLTVDNYEGLAAVSGADGGIRFYLLSDDNGREDQRTILLAFDWRP